MTEETKIGFGMGFVDPDYIIHMFENYCMSLVFVSGTIMIAVLVIMIGSQRKDNP